jgi:uncharacterized membrane protein YqjE
MTDTRPDGREPSTGELVIQLSDQLSRLMRDEVRLAQAELQAKGKRLGAGAAFAGAGAVLAWFAVGAIVCAAIGALALVLPVWAAALIVAVVLLAIAGLLTLVAKRQAAQVAPPIPEKAIEGTRRDIETIKEHAHR